MQIQLTTIAVLLAFSASTVSAADCQNNGQFQTSDANTLVNQIQTNSIPNATIQSSILVKATHSIRFASKAANSGNGGPAFCLNNDFAFDNTHDALADLAFAASNIVQQCCTGATCTGGRFQVKGDTGLATDMILQSGSQSCLNDDDNVVSDIIDGINAVVDQAADQIFDTFDPFKP